MVPLDFILPSSRGRGIGGTFHVLRSFAASAKPSDSDFASALDSRDAQVVAGLLVALFQMERDHEIRAQPER